MKNSKKKKIWFIVLVSIFATLWATSLLFLGFATLSDSITDSIQTWYSNKFEEKTLNLLKVSMWSTVLTTFALTVTLLAKELKKKYISK
jgi:ABC-type phosphate/phosphonate transport system permease subunit